MTSLAVAAVLGAAILHASWNALLRGRGDRLNSITVMSMVSALTGAVAVCLLPHPAPASWPFLALSVVLQTGYCLTLVRAYRDGMLAEIYPIARGSSPMLVTLGAFVLAHERLSLWALAGVALVSAGIAGVALGRGRPKAGALAAAVATGGLIASYTVSDGFGGRASGAPLAYAGWLFLLQGAVMPFAYFALRRRWPTIGRDGDTAKSAIGGVLTVVAYGVVIWALSIAPMGQVSALRETGILFAMVIGMVFLKERPSRRQVLSAAMIAVGAALLA